VSTPSCTAGSPSRRSTRLSATGPTASTSSSPAPRAALGRRPTLRPSRRRAARSTGGGSPSARTRSGRRRRSVGLSLSLAAQLRDRAVLTLTFSCAGRHQAEQVDHGDPAGSSSQQGGLARGASEGVRPSLSLSRCRSIERLACEHSRILNADPDSLSRIVRRFEDQGFKSKECVVSSSLFSPPCAYEADALHPAGSTASSIATRT